MHRNRIVPNLLVAIPGGASVCHAQSSQLEVAHDLGVKQNPAGVTLTISPMYVRSAYHLSEPLRLKLSFVSTKKSFHTVEADETPGNAASFSDDLIIQPPGTTSIHQGCSKR